MTIINVAEEQRETYEEALPENLRGKGLTLFACGEKREDLSLRLAGIAAVESRKNNIYKLVYLHVAADERKKGIATNLIFWIASLLTATGGGSLVCVYALEKETQALESCLKRTGFQIMEKNNVISARLLDYFGSLKSYLNQPSVYEARPLSEVTERQWGTLLRKLSTEKKKKKSDGMVYRQLSGKAAYQQNLSTLSFDREGTPIGVILFSDDGKDLSVDYLWVGGERGKVLVSLLKQSLLSAGKRKFPPDTLVICHAANPTVEQMIEKRLGKEKVKKVPAKAAILDL